MRPPIPGDDDPFLGVRDEIPNVAITGTITAVDTRNGIVGVDVAGLGHRNDVQIPLFQFSFLGDDGSSWFRFMPQVGDQVTLVQNVRGTMHIVNYECLNYRQLANANQANQFLFPELQQGEFEVRSAGLATIYGNKDGTLRIAGGPATFTLRRETLESELDATLQRFKAQSCEIRFGEVRRKLLPIDVEETALASGTLREFRLQVAQDVGFVALPMLDIKAGNVVNDTTPFAPTLGEGGGPLRAHVKVFDAAGTTTAFELQIDALGNVELTQSALATVLGLKIVGLASTMLAQYRDMVLQPSVSFKVGSTGSTENMVLGQQLKTLLTNLINTIETMVIATAMGPASPNPATVAALEALKAASVTSNLILSDYAFVSKLPTPGTG